MKSRLIFFVLRATTFLCVLGSLAFADLEVHCSRPKPGFQTCQISIWDRTYQEVFRTTVNCQDCHKTPLPGGRDLQKSYDSQSHKNHIEVYIFGYLPGEIPESSRYALNEGQKVVWAKGITLSREGGRLTVVNETGRYKLICGNDAVIVKDRFGRPGLITTASPVDKVPYPEPKTVTPIRR